MGWILLVVIVLIIITWNNSEPKNRGKNIGGGKIVYNDSKNEGSTTGKKSRKPITPYEREAIELEVKGIFAERSRIRLYHKLEIGDEVVFEFEPYNAYDKNAIAVYAKRGGMVGYLPRNRRKVIKTLKSGSNYMAVVEWKGDRDGKTRNDNYNLSIRCFFGYPDEDLEGIRELKEFKERLYSMKEEVTTEKQRLNEVYSSLSKSNPRSLFEQLSNVSNKIIVLNELAHEFREMSSRYPEIFSFHMINLFQIRPPLDKLTTVAKKLGEHKFIIQLVGEIQSKPHFQTERQMEKIMKRYEWAKKNSYEEE